MKQKARYGTGLYSFLEKQGVLATGDNSAIEAAKRAYWLDYKKKWNKKKLRECKGFLILFTQKEIKIITRSAQEHNTSPTNFIKQSALASGSKESFIDRMAIGQIRDLLYTNYNVLQDLKHEGKLSEQTADQVLDKIIILERQVLNILRNKPEIKVVEGF